MWRGKRAVHHWWLARSDARAYRSYSSRCKMHRWLQFRELAPLLHCEAGGRKSNLVIRLKYAAQIAVRIASPSPKWIADEFITKTNSTVFCALLSRCRPSVRSSVRSIDRCKSSECGVTTIRWQYSKSTVHPCQFSCSLIASYVPHPIMIRYPLQFLPRRL